MRDLFSTKVRVGLLIIVVLIPALAFIIYGIYNRYSYARNEALKDLTQLARIFSVEQGRSVEASRQLLIAISATPEVNRLNTWECNVYLSNLIKNYSRYANFGVADSSGKIICSAIPFETSVTIKDRLYFQKAITNKSFVEGEYQISQITKKAVLNYGYPILRDDKVTAVVFSSLDLSWVNQFVSSINSIEDTILLVLDGKGVILARSPDPEFSIGESFVKDNVIRDILAAGGGATEKVGIDGIKRLYAFQKLEGSDPTNPSYVVVGRTEKAVYRDANLNLRYSFLILSLALILTAIVSHGVGNILIIKKVEDLERLNKLKAEFVSIASHQLRTPLSAINWFLEILGEKSKNLNRQQKKIIKNIKESNQRMVDLVESLLDVSRIEAKKIIMNSQEVNISEIVRKVIKETSSQLKYKKQKLILKISTKKMPVFADPEILFQVINNIVSNAIKYTPKNGVVEIFIYNRSARVFVKIQDNGYGIPKKDQDKVFNKFFRASNIFDYDADGTGLGLFISKSLAEKMGGEITFQSSEGKGTTFYISFPALL